MQNIATIYRFNTPFLEIEKEKNDLLSIQSKIIDYTSEFEWVEMIKEEEDLWEYLKVKLKTKDDTIKCSFFYIKVFNWNYYAPIFKLNIYVDREKLNNKIVVWFLINIFECFDWLNEKEYLIDLDNSIYYRKNIIYKIYPYYDFTDIDTIRQDFEKHKWNEILEQFIIKFSDKNYKLTVNNSEEYYKIHSIVLYYIYLVYMLYQNIIESNKQLDYLEKVDLWEENHHKELINERLKYVNNITINTFKKYYEKLEIFFKLFE